MKVWELIRKIKINYKRLVAGLVLLVLELCLFFGSGVLLEDASHFLTGEGLWDVALSEEVNEIAQEFKPSHSHLQSVSFRMDLSPLSVWDSEVSVTVSDRKGNVLFEQIMPIQDITDCAYTDVELNLELSALQTYLLTIGSTPTSAGEYPLISVCSTDYELPESRKLTHAEEIPANHLVSRYQYTDGLTKGRAIKAVFLCLVTALGVVVGLPRNKYVRKGFGVILLIAAPYVLGRRLELLTYNEMFYLPFSLKWNLGIMYGLELIVLLATHSAAVSVVLTNVALTILYSANYFMLMYRGTALRMNDLTAVGTVKGVIGEYDLTPNSRLAMVWAIAVLFVVFGIQTHTIGLNKPEEGRKNLSRKRILVVIASYVFSIALAVSLAWAGGRKLIYTDYLEQKGFEGKAYTGLHYELIYSFDGYLVGTCVELNNSRIVKPEGYSTAKVEEVLGAIPQKDDAAQDLPHVILIMNESLSDVRSVTDVELSQENMPFLKSLEENTIKGFANVSTFGGGTANAEFEVFTGCTMGFLPVNYYPYQQAMRRPVNSMVSQMKEYGYRTVAMHPEVESNWNRKNIYKYFDFDERLFIQDFQGAEVIHSGVSDAETYNRMIEIYENKAEGERLFLFDLTMQNHGGYDQEDGPDEVQALGLNNPELDEYLSLIKISDQAFEELVNYFAAQDEKVIICMFGDHQPWVFDQIAGINAAGTSLEILMNKYRTPYVIWANYDIEEISGYDISLNYLGGIIMNVAGVPLSPYFSYLDELRKEYPILTVNGYVDKDGNYNNWSGNGDEFEEYRMLQYNYLFDDSSVEWGY